MTFDVAVDFGLHFLFMWDIPYGFSMWTLLGFLIALWLGSTGKYLQREKERDRERVRQRHINFYDSGWWVRRSICLVTI